MFTQPTLLGNADIELFGKYPIIKRKCQGKLNRTRPYFFLIYAKNTLFGKLQEEADNKRVFRPSCPNEDGRFCLGFFLTSAMRVGYCFNSTSDEIG